MTGVCAIVAFRNERRYLPTLLQHLMDEGVDVYLIDNGSTDGSLEVVERYIGAPVICVKHMPYSGAMDLASILDAKAAVISELKHDWIIHQDFDEILQSKMADESLSELSLRATRSGVGLIDFDEFVFLPQEPAGYEGGDYRRGVQYYFFQPWPFRFNRRFRRSFFAGFGRAAGHSVMTLRDTVAET